MEAIISAKYTETFLVLLSWREINTGMVSAFRNLILTLKRRVHSLLTDFPTFFLVVLRKPVDIYQLTHHYFISRGYMLCQIELTSWY